MQRPCGREVLDAVLKHDKETSVTLGQGTKERKVPGDMRTKGCQDSNHVVPHRPSENFSHVESLPQSGSGPGTRIQCERGDNPALWGSQPSTVV